MNAMPLDLGEAPAAVTRKTIPFDVAFRYDLTGEPDRVHRETVTISIEATFVAVSVGYGIVPTVDLRTFGPTVAPVIFAGPNGVSTATVRASAFRSGPSPREWPRGSTRRCAARAAVNSTSPSPRAPS